MARSVSNPVPLPERFRERAESSDFIVALEAARDFVANAVDAGPETRDLSPLILRLEQITKAIDEERARRRIQQMERAPLEEVME